jgi:ATP-dependent DNA helicase 2 subunit 2
MAVEDTYSPIVHRINQAVKLRAIRPNERVQPPAESLVKFSHPPEDLVNESASQLKRLIAAADVKKGKNSYLLLNSL